MDKKRLKEEIIKLFSDKKVTNLLAIVLFLICTVMAINVLTSNSVDDGKQIENEVLAKEETQNKPTITSYEENQKNELVGIIKRMQGVGEVRVMMTFESGEEQIPAIDSNVQTTVTEETDKEGGKRENKQTTDGSKVVMTSNGNGNEPFITKTNKPKVIGVVVVAEGAEVSKVRADIEKAVSNLYNLTADKVNVYPMG